jgi:hypothetical protein
MWEKRNRLYVETGFESAGAVCFTTTAVLGDMKEFSERERFLSSEGIENLIFGQQTHSDNLASVSAIDCGKSFSSIDGYITADRQLALGVFTADCLPVFIFDPVRRAAGIVHAGRVGIEKSFIRKALGIFFETYKSDPADVFVAVGPHIRNCCYPMDLELEAREQITASGVENASFAGVCTHEDDFFSYRRDGTAKRMLSVVMIK